MLPAQFTVDEDQRTYDLRGQAGPLMEIMQILKANNIPMNGTIDIRSNPAVRQQVMNVVLAKSTPDGEKQAYTTAPGRLRNSERLRTPEPGQKIAATAITTAGSRMKTPTT